MIGIGSDTNITIKLGTSDIEAYLGTVKVYPNTAPVPTPYAEQYFTVEAIDDNTVVHYEYTSPLLYNSSDGINWTSMDDGDNLWVTPNYQKEADDNGFSWNYNPTVTGEDGKYLIVLAEYTTASAEGVYGFGMAAIALK